MSFVLVKIRFGLFDTRQPTRQRGKLVQENRFIPDTIILGVGESVAANMQSKFLFRVFAFYLQEHSKYWHMMYKAVKLIRNCVTNLRESKVLLVGSIMTLKDLHVLMPIIRKGRTERWHEEFIQGKLKSQRWLTACVYLKSRRPNVQSSCWLNLT